MSTELWHRNCDAFPPGEALSMRNLGIVFGAITTLLASAAILFLNWNWLTMPPIAEVTFTTPEGDRVLYSYPVVAKLGARYQHDIVTPNFCRWDEVQDGKQNVSGADTPDTILLQCNFDRGWSESLHSDSRLELRVTWERVGERYERTEANVQTSYGKSIARTKRNNCSSSNCKIEFEELSLPKTFDDKLVFDFQFDTPIVKNSSNDEFMFASEIHFKGEAGCFDALNSCSGKRR